MNSREELERHSSNALSNALYWALKVIFTFRRFLVFTTIDLVTRPSTHHNWLSSRKWRRTIISSLLIMIESKPCTWWRFASSRTLRVPWIIFYGTCTPYVTKRAFLDVILKVIVLVPVCVSFGPTSFRVWVHSIGVLSWTTYTPTLNGPLLTPLGQRTYSQLKKDARPINSHKICDLGTSCPWGWPKTETRIFSPLRRNMLFLTMDPMKLYYGVVSA